MKRAVVGQLVDRVVVAVVPHGDGLPGRPEVPRNVLDVDVLPSDQHRAPVVRRASFTAQAALSLPRTHQELYPKEWFTVSWRESARGVTVSRHLSQLMTSPYLFAKIALGSGKTWEAEDAWPLNTSIRFWALA